MRTRLSEDGERNGDEDARVQPPSHRKILVVRLGSQWECPAWGAAAH